MTRLAALMLALAMAMVGCGQTGAPAPNAGSTAAVTAALAPADEPETTPVPSKTAAVPTATIAPLQPTQQAMPAGTAAPVESNLPTASPVTSAVPAKDELDEAQKNSVAMLNYLAVLSQEINASKNSRMFLEEAYASLINNTNPEKVNELTESHLSSLLDIIEKYRMISVKRDRLQYIYDQNKAKALKEAVPNPLGLLSAVGSINLKRLAASAIYMAVDSYSSYQAYNTEIAQQFLQDGWELDDEEAANLHDSRKRAFMFMIEIVREDNLPGELALSENAVDSFVTWKNKTNNYQKIRFFESEEATYKAFGNYWLELASCYYQAEEYEKCLEAMDKYEELQADIFRKDYYLAQALPNAIVAASEVYSKEEYIPVAGRYLDLLLANTESSEWSLRYFAAEIYIDLYAKTGSKSYIDKAYEVALDNVNNLVAEQQALNAAYIAEVQEVATPESAEKTEKEQIDEYNKSLHEQRKVELAPVYEPLILNCDLLFALAEERRISQKDKTRIDGILRGNGDVLFLNAALENKYTFAAKENTDIAVQLIKDSLISSVNALIVPASCVSADSIIKVTVKNDGMTGVYSDWTIKEVQRPSERFDTFTVTYTSENIGNQEWSEGAEVKVEIFADEASVSPAFVFDLKVIAVSNWKVWDPVEFEQVK